MPLNSALDSWQTACILTAELPDRYPNQTDYSNGVCAAADGWAACSRNPEQCTAPQVNAMNDYIGDFEADLRGGKGTYSAPGNGAFVHSCHTHCEAQNDEQYTRFAIGGVTMQQAVSKWWSAEPMEPAAAHTYSPCLYNPAAPHKCNPTC